MTGSKSAEQQHAEDEASALAAIEEVQKADKDQQAEAVAGGFPAVPADHVTIGYIPGPEEEAPPPPEGTEARSKK